MTCFNENVTADSSSEMRHCDAGCIVPGFSKDRNAIFCRARQLKKSSFAWTLEPETVGTTILRNVGNFSPNSTD